MLPRADKCRIVTIRQHYLFVCNNRRPDGAPKKSCQAQGSIEVFAALKSAIAEAGLAQEVARCVQTGCLDLCDDGPVVLIEPDHLVYAHVAATDVPEIVEALRSGEPVQRLLKGAKSSEQ